MEVVLQSTFSMSRCRMPYIEASSRLDGIEMQFSRQNQRGCDRQRTEVAAMFFLTSYLSPVYSMPEANKPMTETTSRDLFPGALEMMILESLRRQPSHGYALVQQIQQRSKNLLQVEEGSLYPALQRLLKAKLVKAQWGVSPANRRVCAGWTSRFPVSNECLKALHWS
jgi:hypothetical protein